MQPSGNRDNEEWAFCGHAVHNDAFFESYRTCTTVTPNNPTQGFTCETRATPGVEESDFVLYVTAVESSYCESAAAYAMYCSLDRETNRPLAGSINFCPSSLSSALSDFEHQVEVAVHELLHTLVIHLLPLSRGDMRLRSFRNRCLTNLSIKMAKRFRSIKCFERK